MEQYRYAIEELVADETAAENKRLEQEAKDTEFATQKVGVNTLYIVTDDFQTGLIFLRLLSTIAHHHARNDFQVCNCSTP